jgi:dGTPase
VDWSRLLSRQRLGRRDSREVDARSPFQRDYDRIVFSSAFRRLQDKTQVFPLAESDYVRTRLTHSIEVSCVGRSLGTLVGAEVLKKKRVDGVTSQDFGTVVAAACLAHDIGNPPFGHSGEDAIQNWFQARGEDYLKDLKPAEREDFLRFEGNAQGFRVLTRLQNPQNKGGLQMTYAVLGAFSKYPRQSVVSSMQESTNVSEKKFGFFSADAGSFNEIAEGLGLKQKALNAWSRHPLAFLTEAADDICYRIIDFEDGFRLGRVLFSEVEPPLKEIAFKNAQQPARKRYQRLKDPRAKIEQLRAMAINNLVHAAVKVFCTHSEEILSGQFEQSLLSKVPFRKQLRNVEKLSFAQIYATPPVAQIESAGFEVLGGLLDRVVPVLTRDTAKLSAADKKLLQIIPPQFRGGVSYAEKLYHATDFVSGMTDSYAVTLYRRLRGIELPRGS